MDLPKYESLDTQVLGVSVGVNLGRYLGVELAGERKAFAKRMQDLVIGLPLLVLLLPIFALIALAGGALGVVLAGIVVAGLGVLIVYWLILFWMYRRKIFLRI